MQNRTSIVIAHRLSTIQEADQIIVLENGKIQEQGNHNELILADGLYKKLIEMQTFND
jgi:subfamily B ATP-binding cassette protein MsbA